VPVDEVRKLYGEGKGPAEIAAALGVSRMSVWRALNRDHSGADSGHAATLLRADSIVAGGT
jgi:DNA invertase Pin-like site-specific DNA recombinase